jgi:hypothetical protein
MNTKRLDTQNASARASMVAFAVRGATQNMEVLAGTGHLAEARVLAEKLLTIDGSDATRAAIREHFERAGQPSPVPSP